MAILHSYVSLREGNQRTETRASPCNGKIIFQHLPSEQNPDVGWNPVSSQRLRTPKGTVFGIAQKHHEKIHGPDSAGLNQGRLCATWTMWRKCPAVTENAAFHPTAILAHFLAVAWANWSSSICWTPENHKTHSELFPLGSLGGYPMWTTNHLGHCYPRHPTWAGQSHCHVWWYRRVPSVNACRYLLDC